MNTEEFIEMIKIVVEKSSVDSIISILLKPPGREPKSNLILMSDWYNSLNENDKEHVLNILREAVNTTIFGFLCMLDGVRSIENGSEKGKLSLYYQKGEVRSLLNNPDEEYLHDLFSSE